jgi:hypothetical protein
MEKNNVENTENLPEVPEEQKKKGIVAFQEGRLQNPMVMVPEDIEGLWRVATMFTQSGMVPKGLMINNEARIPTVATAIQMGLEVGLSPSQSMRYIAVINGKPSVYGDALLGIVRGSGQLDYIKETYQGEGNALRAVCEVKRKDDASITIEEFSIEDAKTANLWGKQGPWSNYPKRMLKMRARGFALRDLFSDILSGLAVAEEQSDILLTETAPGVYEPATNGDTQELSEKLKGVKVNKKTGEFQDPPIRSFGDYKDLIEACKDAKELNHLWGEIYDSIQTDIESSRSRSRLENIFKDRVAEFAKEPEPAIDPEEEQQTGEPELEPEPEQEDPEQEVSGHAEEPELPGEAKSELQILEELKEKALNCDSLKTVNELVADNQGLILRFSEEVSDAWESFIMERVYEIRQNAEKTE